MCVRVLILHPSTPKMTKLATEFKGEFEKANCRADTVSEDSAAGNPITAAPYDLVCVLSSFKGLWRPIIPIEIDNLLKRCTRLQGKKGAAFLTSRPGSNKALKFLMHLMEAQGMLVEDFATIRSGRDFAGLIPRLVRIAERK